MSEQARQKEIKNKITFSTDLVRAHSETTRKKTTHEEVITFHFVNSTHIVDQKKKRKNRVAK